MDGTIPLLDCIDHADRTQKVYKHTNSKRKPQSEKFAKQVMHTRLLS